MTEEDKYLVQTRPQAKSSGVKVPEVNGIEKSLDPHVKPERQKSIKPPMDKRLPIPKPKIGQGRAGIRGKARTVPHPQTPVPNVTPSLSDTVTQPQVTVQIEHQLLAQTGNKQPIGPRIENRPIPFYPDLTLRLPPCPPDLKETRRDLLDLDTERNINLEENSPYQEGVISEMYERLDRSYFKEPSELKDLIDTTKLVQKFLPKQILLLLLTAFI